MSEPKSKVQSPVYVDFDAIAEKDDHAIAAVEAVEKRNSSMFTSKSQNGPRPSNQSAKRILASSTSSQRQYLSKMLISKRQEHNPLVKFIREVPYEFGDILADFQVGLTVGVLFLSLKYHRLHPEYLLQRVKMLGKHFQQRVLLVLVDIDDHVISMQELARFCISCDMLLVMATSNEECARYLETFKALESKPPDAIKGRVDDSYMAKLTNALTQIKSVNKTDVMTLLATFGSFEEIAKASADELALCSGFGEVKVVYG